MDALKQLLVPEVTLTILRQLVQRKAKQDALKRKLVWWGMIFLSCIVFASIFVTMQLHSVSTGERTYNDLMKSPSLWGVALAVFGTYWQFFLTRKSFEEAEEEYEALRMDVLNRSTELWSTEEQWEMRHLVFEFMKEQFDINLYYE